MLERVCARKRRNVFEKGQKKGWARGAKTVKKRKKETVCARYNVEMLLNGDRRKVARGEIKLREGETSKEDMEGSVRGGGEYDG